jgi:hypothetical protein
MNRVVQMCALVLTVAVAGLIATTVARTDQGGKLDPPTFLGTLYPVGPRPKASTPRSKTPGPTEPRRRPASYQISTDQTGSPRLLLLTVFLAGLVVVGTAMLVGWRLRPIRDRRRPSREPALRGPANDLLEALQPKPQPEPVPELVVAERGREPARRATHRMEATVARCEIKLWRGFLKSHLYAVGSNDEPIAFSPYFHLLEDDRSSSEGLQALAALVAELEQDGWTVVSDGPAWYQHRLERSERF